ncbi:hypothetical protein OGATHE_003056 [Ogataea polymorpha]|uniref:Uncharacterized protein n=1 Tax=Ogataea polymorpha TaxID=460523 RepID=A0A9P8PDH5_9ASCO|nr:hypothetical protein OGATHE_003056 [Ogataea polymorpha]
MMDWSLISGIAVVDFTTLDIVFGMSVFDSNLRALITGSVNAILCLNPMVATKNGSPSLSEISGTFKLNKKIPVASANKKAIPEESREPNASQKLEPSFFISKNNWAKVNHIAPYATVTKMISNGSAPLIKPSTFMNRDLRYS